MLLPERSVKYNSFFGRVGLLQRVLPAYRGIFFDSLAEVCEGGLSIFAGQPLEIEEISTIKSLKTAQYFAAKNLHFRDPSSAWYLCWQRGILKWLNEWDAQVLIVEANPRYISTRLAIQWMHQRNRSVIGWGLGACTLRGFLSQVRAWERSTFLHSLDGIIAYSQNGAKEYLNAGFSKDRIFIAPNAVARKPRLELPPRKISSSGTRTVLFVGRLQFRKRIDNLLLACAALPLHLKPRLIIVGEGPERPALEELANKVYPKAEFLGAKYGDELDAVFSLADIFVLPGTGGLAVQQALGFGLPVIVGRGDGTQDAMVTPENGWLVAPDSLADLTVALNEALSDPIRLGKMSAESYRIAQEEVNIEKMVNVFVEAMQKCSKGSQS